MFACNISWTTQWRTPALGRRVRETPGWLGINFGEWDSREEHVIEEREVNQVNIEKRDPGVVPFELIYLITS